MSTPTTVTPNGDTEALQKWHLAKRRAERNNRNFVHYSTIVAAVLAIVSGTSGVFAVAVTQGRRSFLHGLSGS